MDKKLVNTKQKNVLWIDLEMTGLNPIEDRILEVGVIVTDWSFKEITTYEAAVHVDEALVEARVLKGPSKDFWESVPEVRDALLKQNAETDNSIGDIEDELLKLVDKHFEKVIPIILAGNSIHMDRRFIEREWPRLNERLHYRMLDVTSWKVIFENAFKVKFAKREAHRALDDIRGSIEELLYYLKKFKKNS